VFKCPPGRVWIIIHVYITFCALKFVTVIQTKYWQNTVGCLLGRETFWYIAHFVSQGTMNKSTRLGSPVTCPSDIFTVFFFVRFCVKCRITDSYSILGRLTVKWIKFSFILSVNAVVLCAWTLLSSPYCTVVKLYLYSNARLRSACLITFSWCGA
jgi:hypothetical protein